MVGFRRPRMYNPQEEKTKQAKLFEKKIFLILLLYFSSLWPPFLLSIQTFWKRANSFWKMPTILFLFTNTSIIITYLLLFCYIPDEKKKPDLPTLLIYILLILLFLLHHNIDAFKRNDYYFAKTKTKVSNFRTKTKPHMQKFCPRKESKQIIILTSLNLLKKTVECQSKKQKITLRMQLVKVS